MVRAEIDPSPPRGPPMKVRTPFPGPKVDDVTYRPGQCGVEVEKPVTRAR